MSERSTRNLATVYATWIDGWRGATTLMSRTTSVAEALLSRIRWGNVRTSIMFLFTRNWRGLKNILFHFVANHVESSFTHFFASAFDASFSRSSSWRFLASSLTFIMESRQQANMSSMIAAAGVDTLENARCDRRALRAEHVPVGQSRSTLGGSTLSSRHAHVFLPLRDPVPRAARDGARTRQSRSRVQTSWHFSPSASRSSR